jgi:ribosomal protein L10
MNKVNKGKIINQIVNIATDAMGIFVINIKSLETSEIISFKKKLRPMQGNINVFKNTLLRLAAEKNSILQSVKNDFSGQVAIIHFNTKDVFQPSQICANFLDSNKEKIVFKNAVIGNKVITQEKFQQISKIASLSQLQGQLCGILKNPIISLVRILKAITEKNNIN